MKNGVSKKSLLDGYHVPGFRTLCRVKGRFGDRSALVVNLIRRQKKQSVADVAPHTAFSTIVAHGRRETLALVGGVYILSSSFDESIARSVVP